MKQDIKIMTTAEYKEARGNISVQAICQAARKNYNLPGVMRFEKKGKFYLFHVNLELLKAFGKNKKKYKLHV